jgi:hypothetical protein
MFNVNSYRSKDGNAGGMSFSSGNGKGFAFGGTFNVLSQSRDIILDTMTGALSACTLLSSKREHTENLLCKVR